MTAELRALLDQVPPEEIPEIMGTLFGRMVAAWVRSPRGNGDGGDGAPDDDLMTVAEAAELLKVDKDWIYRRSKTLPFMVRLSPGVVRCSRARIVRYIAQRTGR